MSPVYLQYSGGEGGQEGFGLQWAGITLGLSFRFENYIRFRFRV